MTGFDFSWIGSGFVLVVLAVVFLVSAIRIFREYERGVVFTLGRFWQVKGPGLVIIIPIIQQAVRVDLRTVVLEVPTQDVISRDNVSVKVSAVVYLRVIDPQKAIIQVVDYLNATSQLAQTMLRSVLGKHQLDDMLAEREKLNADIQQALDAQTDSWGIKVANVEIKQVDLTESMIRAIARQAEAERERRAKVIHAEGELQAVRKAVPGGEDPRAGTAGHPVALPGNADGHRRRQEHDHRLSAAHGPAEAVSPESEAGLWAADRRPDSLLKTFFQQTVKADGSYAASTAEPCEEGFTRPHPCASPFGPAAGAVQESRSGDFLSHERQHTDVLAGPPV